MNKNIVNLHFDNIYVLHITMYELERIKEKIQDNNLTVQYFRGVNGKATLLNKFTEYYDNHRKNKSKSFMKTVGAFGHVHSMINIIQDAIEKKYKKILILEPDIYFIENFQYKVKQYLSLDYKLLYLGASQHNWTNIKNYTSGLYYAQDTYGTFAIAIDNSIFTEYLNILKKLENPSDVCLYQIQKKYPTQCIVTYPNLISCDLTKSTTANRWRSQLELSTKFKWYGHDYQIYDKFPYDVNPNSIYKIVIELNYYEPNKSCYLKIVDNNNNDITPIIYVPDPNLVEQKLKLCDGKHILGNEYGIYIYPKAKRISVCLFGIYTDHIHFFEFFKDVENNKKLVYTHLNQKVSRYLNSKNNLIVNHYKGILNQLV